MTVYNNDLSIHSRFVTKLLEDLIFFVADVPNNGQEVLDVVITKPNRERQKLMREQNILAQVCPVLIIVLIICLYLQIACRREWFEKMLFLGNLVYAMLGLCLVGLDRYDTT